MKPRPLLASLALVLAALAIGCGLQDPLEDDVASTQQALVTPLFQTPQNGLDPGGIEQNSSLLRTIWRHPLSPGGVAITLGEPVSPGSSILISSLFNTGNSKTSAEYLMEEIVSCALDSSRVVTATLPNTTTGVIWKGQFGLCDTGSPFGNWWNSGATDECKYMVSACILARMNGLGKHVPISIRIPTQITGGATRFRLADKVRVQKMLRNGQLAATDWTPDFVGTCERDTIVTLQRAPAPPGLAVRVCLGIHACEQNQDERIVENSPRVYSGFLKEFPPGPAGELISFPCPANASTAPNNQPERSYFGILVKPSTGGVLPPSPDPILVPASNPTTTYPAPEKDIFTYVEGAFYGNIFTEPNVAFDRNACYSSLWKEGSKYMSDRICTMPGQPCSLNSGPCDKDCNGRSPMGDQAYYGFNRYPTPRWTGVTVFLNDVKAISAASEIEFVHDVCTPGASLVPDGPNGVVTNVCNSDPYCCSVAWDDRCVSRVQTVPNGPACETIPCSHPVCTTGDKLDNSCSPVVTSVCVVDPYCCNTAWDSTCVQEVLTIANSQECGCSHPVCTTGVKLNNGCSPIVTSVCAKDPYCCNTTWDSFCVSEVKTVANSQECDCSHPVCTTGAALSNGCSSIVTSVCAADPYCCNAAWDSKCVQEVLTVAHSQECSTGTCGHSVCTAGTALTNGCSPVVTSVCTADPYCCNTAWDSKCVQEVVTVANSQECTPP